MVVLKGNIDYFKVASSFVKESLESWDLDTEFVVDLFLFLFELQW